MDSIGEWDLRRSDGFSRYQEPVCCKRQGGDPWTLVLGSIQSGTCDSTASAEKYELRRGGVQRWTFANVEGII
jgi:hypothetical protein